MKGSVERVRAGFERVILAPDWRLFTSPRRAAKIRFSLRVGYWVLPATAIFLLPLLMWTGVTGNLMNLGGDDSHFMYAYPLRWLEHASLPALDQGFVGYNPRTYFIPFTLVASFIQAIGLNTEGVIFGATLALTYLGITRLTLELLGGESPADKAAAAVAGTIAICAPLIAETQWSSLLTAIVWQPLLPWLLLLFIWHQRTGRARTCIAAGVTVAVGAVAINEIPWTLPCGMLLLGLALVAYLAGTYRFNLKRFLIFVTVVLGLSAFWIVPIIAAPVFQQAQFAYAVSAIGKSDAIKVVRTLAPLMSLSDALQLRNSTRLMEAFGHPELVANQWSSQRFQILGLLPLFVVAGGVLRTGFARRSVGTRLTFGLGLLLVLFLYLETLQLIPAGVRIFEVLTNSLPGWVSVRNFYDKFATPFVLVYAITAGVCLRQLLRALGSPAALLVGVVLAGAFAIYDLPFLTGAEFRMPYYGDVAYNRVMPGLPASYTALLQKLEQLPAGPVLTLPLSNPSWSVVPSDKTTGVYIGVSPIFFITGRSDFNGVQSFSTPLVPYLASMIADDLTQGQTKRFARVVAEVGIRYVVVATADDFAHDFYRSGAVADPLQEATETAELIRELAPREIASFGPYQLREIATTYQKPLLSLVRPPNGFAGSSSYLEAVNLGIEKPSMDPCGQSGQIRIVDASPDHYVVAVPPTVLPCRLVLRVPFSQGWQIVPDHRGTGGGQTTTASREIYGFANSFDIATSSEWRTVELEFQPRVLINIGIFLSIASLGACLLALGVRAGSFRFERLRRWALRRLFRHAE